MLFAFYHKAAKTENKLWLFTMYYVSRMQCVNEQIQIVENFQMLWLYNAGIGMLENISVQESKVNVVVAC